MSSLPAYLQKYVVTQDYDAYTPEEQATWRYIMRQLRAFFTDHAVPIYMKGLQQTGIPIDRIPRIEEMNDKLSAFGWGAVGVEGFIPGNVFLDLLARGVLPIATDMRTKDHIAYTPAPDIVHEAAGHAPIIADAAYRKFLSQYAQIAYRSIISHEDIRLYEAIRFLSDIKENPDIGDEQQKLAEKRLHEAYESLTFTSESTRVTRMAWWTTEYGLVGTEDAPKIYGAGLLSSIGESRACLSPDVKKIPLTAACSDVSYDITEPQPQLFIAPSLEHLPEVLEELQKSFAFVVGGVSGLAEAKRAETINTVQLENGVSASGQLIEFEYEGSRVDFVKFTGECQLAYQEAELPNQGRSFHPSGFSCPVGYWSSAPERAPSTFNKSDLLNLGICVGRKAKIDFLSGFCVEGDIDHIEFADDLAVLIKWKNCRVHRGERMYFEPSWGDFDMLIGANITSVFAGPADRAAYGNYNVGEATTSPGRKSPYSAREKSLFSVYESLKTIRSSQDRANAAEKLPSIAAALVSDFPSEWLPALELIELASNISETREDMWLKDLRVKVGEKISSNPDSHALWESGLEIASVVD